MNKKFARRSKADKLMINFIIKRDKLFMYNITFKKYDTQSKGSYVILTKDVAEGIWVNRN